MCIRDRTVTGKRDIRRYDDYGFKRYSCGGNILFDSAPNSFQVKVPMDGAIPLKVCLEQKAVSYTHLLDTYSLNSLLLKIDGLAPLYKYTFQ